MVKIRMPSTRQWNVPLILMMVSGSLLNLLLLIAQFLFILTSGRKPSPYGYYMVPVGLAVILSSVIFLPLFIMGLFRGIQSFLRSSRTSLLEMIVFCVGVGLTFSMISNVRSFNLASWIACIGGICITGVCMTGILSKWKSVPGVVRLLCALFAPFIGSGLGQPFQALAGSGICIAIVSAYGIYNWHLQQLAFPRNFAVRKLVVLK